MKTLEFTKQIMDDSYTRKRIFRLLVGALSLCCVCYVYFIGSITFSILARRTLESDMRETSSRVSALEVEYLTLSNNIDIPSGTLLGFVDPQGKIFATRVEAPAVAIR